MSDQTIQAELYLWHDEDENGPFSYHGWRIKDYWGHTIAGCSGYATRWEALDAFNAHCQRVRDTEPIDTSSEYCPF